MDFGSRNILIIFPGSFTGYMNSNCLLCPCVTLLEFLRASISGCQPSTLPDMNGKRKELMVRSLGSPWGCEVGRHSTCIYRSTKIPHREGKLFSKMKLDTVSKAKSYQAAPRQELSTMLVFCINLRA